MKVFKRYFCAIIALIAILSQISLYDVALAGSERQQIFRDPFTDDAIDTFKWDLSNPDTEAITRGAVSETEGIAMKGNQAGWNTIRYPETVALSEGEAVEIAFTVQNGAALYIMPSFNAAQYYETEPGTSPAFGSIAFFSAGDLMTLNTFAHAQVPLFTGYVAGDPIVTMSGNAYAYPNIKYNGEDPAASWVGAQTNIAMDANKYSKPIEIRAVFYADGSLFYHLRVQGDEDWMTLCYVKAGIEITNGNPEGVGVETLAHPTKPGETADSTSTQLPSVAGKDAYPAIAFTNPVAGSITDFIVSGISVSTIDNGGEVKESISTDYNDWEAYSAPENIFFQFEQSALIVENAPDDDFIVQKTSLIAPQNNLNSHLYDIDLDIYIDRLTADGEAVIYLGATDKTTLAGAAELYFRKTEEGKTMVGVRNPGVTGEEVGAEQEVVFDTLTNTFKRLRVRNLKDGKNIVTLDGTEVARFTKDLKNTYFAFGTQKGNGTARLAVKNLEVWLYNYLQSTGGNFIEDFEDGKYNSANLLIQVHPDSADPEALKIEDGKLVLDNAYGVTISTIEEYSDFEFIVKLTAIGDSETSSPFGMTFAKPVAESSEGLMHLQYQLAGNVVIIGGLGDYIDYADGYSDWSMPAEDDLKPYLHDYTEGPLYLKVVKRGEIMELYSYSNPESDAAKTPYAVYSGCFGSGSFDFRCLPTGIDLTVSIDEISVKNLDEIKAENLYVGSDDDRIELVVKPVEPTDPEPTDPEPTDPKDPENKGGCGGCNQSQASAVLIMIGSLSVALLMKRR